MTISEFRAWLEGFSETIGDAPTAERWAKIMDKIVKLKLAPAPVGDRYDTYARLLSGAHESRVMTDAECAEKYGAGYKPFATIHKDGRVERFDNQEWLDWPVSCRIWNLLANRLKFTTLAEVRGASDKFYLGHENFGKKSLAELREVFSFDTPVAAAAHLNGKRRADDGSSTAPGSLAQCGKTVVIDGGYRRITGE